MKYSITAMAFIALLAACSVKSERTVQTAPVAATTTTTAVPAASTTVVTPAVPAASTTTVVTR